MEHGKIRRQITVKLKMEFKILILELVKDIGIYLVPRTALEYRGGYQLVTDFDRNALKFYCFYVFSKALKFFLRMR